MDIEQKELHIVPPKRIEGAGAFALIMLGVFLLVLTISSLKGYPYIGSGVSATNTISVSGEGEVFAVPDTATFTASVTEEGKDVKTAQDAATKKNNDIIAYLKSAGVEEKDIQTTDYNVSPEYDYNTRVCPSGGYCPGGKPTLVGFQVSETLTIKVRDTQKAGELLSGIGSKGVSNVSGLQFTVADEKGLEETARAKAIQDARAKAEVLARDLGVSLVRVVNFSENGQGGPIYYAKASAMGMGASAPSPAPEIATGQNKIVSNVSVSYEIR